MNYNLTYILSVLSLVLFSCDSNPKASTGFQPIVEKDVRPALKGTTKLPWTQNQQIAKGYGFFLDTIRIRECDQTKAPPKHEEITSIKEDNSKLIIESNIIGNCCHEFLCDIEVINGRTLNLIHYGYGNTYCSCTCCFGLTYEITIMPYEQYEKVENVMLNGNKITLKEK